MGAVVDRTENVQTELLVNKAFHSGFKLWDGNGVTLKPLLHIWHLN